VANQTDISALVKIKTVDGMSQICLRLSIDDTEKKETKSTFMFVGSNNSSFFKGYLELQTPSNQLFNMLKR
jgi:hypothetical protein